MRRGRNSGRSTRPLLINGFRTKARVRPTAVPIILAPRGADLAGNINEGLRSLHSLNPWLISHHASGVERQPEGLLVPALCAPRRRARISWTGVPYPGKGVAFLHFLCRALSEFLPLRLAVLEDKSAARGISRKLLVVGDDDLRHLLVCEFTHHMKDLIHQRWIQR